MKKRSISILLVLSLIISLIGIPNVALAFDTTTSAGVVDDKNKAATYSNKRADWNYVYLGTTEAVSDTDGYADLVWTDDARTSHSTANFKWKPGDVVWVGIEFTHMDRVQDLFDGTVLDATSVGAPLSGLNGFYGGIAWDDRYLTLDIDNAAGIMEEWLATDTYTQTAAKYNFTPQEAMAFDTTDENYAKGLPLHLSIINDDPDNTEGHIQYSFLQEEGKATIANANKLFKDVTFTGSENYLMAVFAMKMNDVAEPAPGTIALSGAVTQETTVLQPGDNKNGYLEMAYTTTFETTDTDAGDADVASYFNITNRDIDLFPAKATIKYDPGSGSYNSTVGTDPVVEYVDVDGGKKPTLKADVNVSGTISNQTVSDLLDPPSGETFLYWQDSAGNKFNTTYTFPAGTTNTSTITVTAVYGVPTVTRTVTYKPGNTATGTFDGTETELTETVNDNNPATFNVTVSGTTYDISGGANYMTAPTNYVFDGWYDGTTKVTPGTYVVTGDVTLTAKYVRPDRTVTFHRDSQDGSITGQEIYTGTSTTVTTNATQTETVANGDSSANVSTYKVKPPAATSSAAYNFSGWSLDGTNPYTATTAVTGDIDLYPLFTPISQYKLTFDLKGGNISGSTTNPSSDIYNGSSYDDAVTAGFISSANDIRTITPTKTGFTFAGWQKSGSTDAFSDTTAYDADTTFEAQWTENTIDLTFKDSKTASAAADSTITIAEGSSIDASNSSNSTKYPATDVPASLTPAANYKWYGWYTLEGSTALTDVQGKTKAALDTLKTGNGIKEFTKTTTASADTTIYGLYYLSDDATLSGVVFKEEDNSGRSIDFVQDNNFNPVQLPKTLATGKTAADYTLGTPATFAAATTTYYMIVDNDVENVYANLTTTETGSTVTVKKGSSTTDLGNPATIPVDVTKNKSYNTVNVEVTAPDGTTTKTYVFNILRLAVPKIDLAYGNSPAGLIYRDDQQFPTETDKAARLEKFKNSDPKGNLTFLTDDGAGNDDPVPIVSGTLGNPLDPPVYAPTRERLTTQLRPYVSLAWGSYNANKNIITINYDLDKYAYFVYQRETIKDLGYTITNEYGQTSTTGANVQTKVFELTKQMVPTYNNPTAADAADHTQDLVINTFPFNLVNGTKGIMVRNDVYSMDYNYDLSTIYGFTTALDNKRPLIILSALGDIHLTPTPVINGNDSKYLTNNTTKVKNGNTLLAYRCADLHFSTTPVINGNDSKKLTNQTTRIKNEWYKYYPDVN